MEILNYLSILDRRKWVIIVTVIFAFVTTILGVLDMPVSYTATSTLRILTTRVGGTDYSYYDVDYSNRLTQTFANVATSSIVLDELAQHVNRIPKITVSAITDTELIQVIVVDEDPELTQYVANKLADILVLKSQEMDISGGTSVNIFIVERAELPEKPSSISPMILIVLGVGIGLVGGVGLALIFENIDSRAYSIKDIESMNGLTVVGNIPRVSEDVDPVLMVNQLQIEAFRRLRTNLFSPARGDKFKSLMVTSAVSSDGKSSVVANLALSIAQLDLTVVIVDANLRKPKIDHIFDLENTLGLTNVLNEEVELSKIIQQTSYPGISAITSGPAILKPAELLSSPLTSRIIHELEGRFDIVLIDSPPSFSVTDPAVIATQVDGVVLVVRAGWVRKEALQSTLKNLQNVNANLIGVIANQTDLGLKSKFSRTRTQPSGSDDEEMEVFQ
ncbi:MAG: polysaccharide biosynthesis tyrosine autokinase [Anaerolineales bacterium]|nr:polysaccharide biosynthesis tyrosine autokinase [Anaerolineales bacterium]